ncbi:MAG: B12-binding domain-containing radical SAM protein [Planctomycetota bacterium]|jgi:radical SAM superfamily enzyme YgiQ (UPF0313 family)
MSQHLDLVLVSDEPVDWEGDYRSRSSQLLYKQMKALGFSKRDKESVEKRFGIKDYFRPLNHNVTPIDKEQESLYRIRLPHRPHLSLCDLATVAGKAGYSVRVVDNMLRYPSRMEQVKSLLSEVPKAVGISTTFLLTESLVRHYVNTIRNSCAPETKIILGGPSIRKFPQLHGLGDFAIFGDGEDALIAILEVLHDERSIYTIPNTAYTNDDGTLVYGPGAAAACRLRQIGKPYKASKVKIPIADWKTVNRSYGHVFPIEFSRGCRNNCFYCSYDRGKTIRDLEDIRQELIDNAELGIRKYRVGDSDFNNGPHGYPEYPNDVCKIMIELDLDLEWSCFARVDDMTEELGELMKRAGCFAVFFGVESADDGILNKMNKGYTEKEAHEGIRIAKKHGLAAHASFIVGYPGETRQSFENTLEFIIDARPDTVNLGQFRVEQDTIAYAKKEFQVEGLGMTWKHFTMDSQMADILVAEGNDLLLKNGICLGTECGYPTFMGLGHSVEGTLEIMNHLDTVSVDGKEDTEAFKSARQILRDLILNQFPIYIRQDQQAWQKASFF